MQKQISDRVKKMISSERYFHTLGVKEMAVRLSERYGCDTEKAAVAALLHDCARDMPNKLLLQLAERFGILVDDVLKKQAVLLHGPVGAELSRKIFNINDKEILKAIAVHTTGDADMSKLDKIVYIADYIEPRRSFPGVERLRDAAFRDLDKAVLLALNNTIKYVIKKEWLLHPKTVLARNFLLMQNTE
jgi:predicted HD superfamily hydrolase involved in NAD metabolism